MGQGLSSIANGLRTVRGWPGLVAVIAATLIGAAAVTAPGGGLRLDALATTFPTIVYDDAFLVTGTTRPLAFVSARSAGRAPTPVRADTQGRFRLELPTREADAHRFEISSADDRSGLGEEVSEVLVFRQTDPPAAPVVLAVDALEDGLVRISGRAEPWTGVELRVGPRTSAATRSSPTGRFSLVVNATSELERGTLVARNGRRTLSAATAVPQPSYRDPAFVANELTLAYAVNDAGLSLTLKAVVPVSETAVADLARDNQRGSDFLREFVGDIRIGLPEIGCAGSGYPSTPGLAIARAGALATVTLEGTVFPAPLPRRVVLCFPEGFPKGPDRGEVTLTVSDAPRGIDPLPHSATRSDGPAPAWTYRWTRLPPGEAIVLTP